MMKPLLWAGVASFTLGTMVFLLFVLPRVGGTGPVAVLPNGQAAESPSLLAVAVASFGLAAGPRWWVSA